LVSVSVFDLVVILACTYGVVFFLGVAAGRAAVWREVAFHFGIDEEGEGKPEGRPAPHKEDRSPPSVLEAKTSGGQQTRVVKRPELRLER